MLSRAKNYFVVLIGVRREHSSCVELVNIIYWYHIIILGCTAPYRSRLIAPVEGWCHSATWMALWALLSFCQAYFQCKGPCIGLYLISTPYIKEESAKNGGGGETCKVILHYVETWKYCFETLNRRCQKNKKYLFKTSIFKTTVCICSHTSNRINPFQEEYIQLKAICTPLRTLLVSFVPFYNTFKKCPKLIRLGQNPRPHNDQL